MNFFPYAADEGRTFADSLERIAGIPVNFNPLAVQMWYIYLLIGLYLYLPVSRRGWSARRCGPSSGSWLRGA